jgi:hypothetical protein
MRHLQTGLGLLVHCRHILLKDERLIKIDIQVFTMGFDITFSGLYKAINAKIVLVWIDAF